jgi:CysZ protein
VQQGSDFIQGVYCFHQGCKDLFKPGLKRYVLLPIIINVILFSLIFYFGIQYLLNKFDFIFFTLPDWLSWLNWLIKPLQYLLLTIVILASIGIIALVSTLSANLIAAPFNGLLSETYSKLLGHPSPTQPFSTLVISTISRESRKLVYFILRFIMLAIIAAVLYFIPLLNMLIPILFFVMGAWLLAVEYCDYAADNFHQPFKQSLAQLKQQRTMSLGFGLTVMLLSSVPFVNFIVMPAAVLGGTALWHRMDIKP